MANKSQVTTDHDTIRKWVEARGGVPASVKGTGDKKEPGILRIAFPTHGNDEKLRAIDWDEFFEKFEEKHLAFLMQEETAKGAQSRFNKFIARKEAEAAQKAKTSRKSAAVSKPEAAKKTSASSKSTASKTSTSNSASAKRVEPSTKSAKPRKSKASKSAEIPVVIVAVEENCDDNKKEAKPKKAAISKKSASAKSTASSKSTAITKTTSAKKSSTSKGAKAAK